MSLGVYPNIITEYYSESVEIVLKYLIHHVYNITGALVNPNGMTKNSLWPHVRNPKKHHLRDVLVLDSQLMIS